jgi:hypothetical protein
MKEMFTLLKINKQIFFVRGRRDLREGLKYGNMKRGNCSRKERMRKI